MKNNILISCLILLPALLSANAQELGEKLVHRLWQNVQDHKISTIEKYISPEFQETVPSLQIRRNTSQELKSLSETNITSFTIRSLKTTHLRHTLITSYFAQFNQIVDGIPVSFPSTIRLSVWRKVDGKWKWIAHQGGF